MKLRVVQVNCVIDPGTPDPVALLRAWPTLPAVASAAMRAGVEVVVVQASATPGVCEYDELTYHFVTEARMRRSCGPGLNPWRLAAAVSRAAGDVIHFNGLDFPCHARAICGLGVPVLVQDHASRPDARISPFRRWGYGRAAAAAFTSEAMAEPFLRKRQLPPGIPIFPIPESSTYFRAGDRAEARARTGLFGDPALLCVGHFDANKDPLTIVRALKQVLPTLPGAHLWCAFVGTQMLPQVELLLRADAELAAHVHLLGAVPHATIEMLCRASDFFLLGSHRESTGYALLEAMACGSTPIVSDIPAFRALTGNGEIGSLVPTGHPEAFAAAIAAAAAKPREELRLMATSHFERHLSFEAVGAALVDAYAAIASRAPEMATTGA